MRPRLEAICSSVSTDIGRVADIGYDRGTLLMALLTRRPSLRVIGVERQPGARARLLREQPEFVAAAGDRLTLRHGDAFGAIDVNEVDGAIVAGIGAESTAALLRAHPQRISSLQQLVICTPDFNAVVRPTLADLGFFAAAEVLVADRGRFYEVIAAGRGVEPSDDALARVFGPRLVERRDPLLAPWLQDTKRRYRAAISAGFASYAAAPTRAALADKLSQIDALLSRLRGWPTTS